MCAFIFFPVPINATFNKSSKIFIFVLLNMPFLSGGKLLKFIILYLAIFILESPYVHHLQLLITI